MNIMLHNFDFLLVLLKMPGYEIPQLRKILNIREMLSILKTFSNFSLISAFV